MRKRIREKEGGGRLDISRGSSEVVILIVIAIVVVVVVVAPGLKPIAGEFHVYFSFFLFGPPF